MRLKKYLVSCCFGLNATVLLAAVSQAGDLNRNPSVEAINLVSTTQMAEIKSVDQSNWWFDTSQREWSVKRPFSPGGIDSTHMFVVIYKVDGKQLLSWDVDLKNKKVKLR